MKITTFDWSVIMIRSGGHPFNSLSLYAIQFYRFMGALDFYMYGMLFAWLFCQVDVSHFAMFKLPKGKHP